MDIAISFKSRKNNSFPLWATAALSQARAKRNQQKKTIWLKEQNRVDLPVEWPPEFEKNYSHLSKSLDNSWSVMHIPNPFGTMSNQSERLKRLLDHLLKKMMEILLLMIKNVQIF